MNYFFVCVLLVIILYAFYRVYYREELKLMRFLEDRLHCSRTASKLFILYHLREKTGENWNKLISTLFSDVNGLEEYLVPWFLKYIFERTKSESNPTGNRELFESFLIKSGLTEEEYIEKLENLKCVLKVTFGSDSQ